MKNALMIAATGSGCGKTTITCGLLQVMKNKGFVTKSYKCGPDYIDPMFHKKVLGIESQNLDLFFSEKEEIRDIFFGLGEHCNSYGRGKCDVALVEGVMGLYDGLSVDSNAGSSYELACVLDIPVVLVVNARGMGRSTLAMIKGFMAMDDDARIKAVILNQVSPMYYKNIKTQIESELGIKVLGYFPKVDNLSIESRYLGLKLPSEITKIEEDIESVATIMADSIDIDKLLEISRCGEQVSVVGAPEYKVTEAGVVETEQKRGAARQCVEGHKAGQERPIKIGIARDDAFCFYYEENLNLLRRLGVKIVEFSPLHDSVLPEDLDGIILGGGYPELHVKQLSDNVSMRESIRAAIDAGMPSLAECGGFMYLHDAIEVDGASYPLLGVIEGHCAKQDKLVRFGYLNISETNELFIPGPNRSIRGHEFHYYDSTNNGADAMAVKPTGSKSWEAAHIGENHWWGFAHLYYPSNVDFASAFIGKCYDWRKCNG